MTHLRRIKGHESKFKSYDSIDLALEDKSSAVGLEVFEANLKIVGTITTVMVPTRLLDQSQDGCTELPRKKPYRSLEEEDDSH